MVYDSYNYSIYGVYKPTCDLGDYTNCDCANDNI
jgi:hypothetical protein